MTHEDYIEIENAQTNLIHVLSSKLADCKKVAEDENASFAAKLYAEHEAAEVEQYIHELQKLFTEYGY